MVKKRPEKRCELEPNHTHFLLFDDGLVKADHVLQLRAEIENCSRQVSRDTEAEEAIETKIPIVMVLVEGGPSSVRTICQALEINTPVVVVKVKRTPDNLINPELLSFKRIPVVLPISSLNCTLATRRVIMVEAVHILLDRTLATVKVEDEKVRSMPCKFLLQCDW